jgi:asparagine synthase (glutamine-hydrolysing)
MGFPVPLSEWLEDGAREFVSDILSSDAARGRELIDNRKVLEGMHSEERFGRKLWGLLSLELWQRAFHDRGREFRKMLTTKRPVAAGDGMNRERRRAGDARSGRAAAG